MNELNMSGGSRNQKEPLNRTLGKKFANFKTLLDDDEEGDEEEEPEQREEQKFPHQLQSKLQSAVRTNQRAKLSLAQELGALKTEYDDFTPEKREDRNDKAEAEPKHGASPLPPGLLIQDGDDIETREDADDLSDESPEPRMDLEPKPLLRMESPEVDAEREEGR